VEISDLFRFITEIVSSDFYSVDSVSCSFFELRQFNMGNFGICLPAEGASSNSLER
jgi:hypothetical protein